MSWNIWQKLPERFPWHHVEYFERRDTVKFYQVSSTEIRSLTGRGLSTRYLLSDKVATYIKKNRLYRTSPRNSVVHHPTLVGYTHIHSPRNSVVGYAHVSRGAGKLGVYTPPPRGGSTGEYEESDVE